jgi:hypothetical protein
MKGTGAGSAQLLRFIVMAGLAGMAGAVSVGAGGCSIAQNANHGVAVTPEGVRSTVGIKTSTPPKTLE